MLLPKLRETVIQPSAARPARRHWPDIAQQWRLVGPPLRPSAEDIAFCTETIQGWARVQGIPRALILGVTPELYSLPWPAGTDLVAVDHTPSMIDAVWPGPRDAVLCADWAAMPLAAGSRDLALCDGGMHLVPARDHGSFVGSLHRVLAPGGLCCLRLFVPPDPRETPEAVLHELLAGKIANPNILKLRLGIAIQENSKQGVALGDVWDALARVAPDLPRLAEQLGWPLEPLLALNTYRDSATRYHFLSIGEVRQLFCTAPGGFTLESLCVPSYDLGERSPTVVFRRDGR